MGADRKGRGELTGKGGRTSGRPSDLMQLWKSLSRSGSEIPFRYSKKDIPSGKSINRRCSSEVRPEVTESSIRPDAPTSAITPYRAPVREQAESSTPCNTASKSRLSLMRRLAWFSLERRSRKARFSRSSSSAFLIISTSICI